MDENIIPEYYRLGDHLIGQNPQNLVIYGEENGIFTLSIAIASMRDHRHDAEQVGIKVAYGNPNHIPDFNDIREQVHIQQPPHFFFRGEEIPQHFLEVDDVPNFANGNWQNVDLHNFPVLPCDVVWFQCLEDIPQLDIIRNFMGVMKEKQGSGKYLVIEILHFLDPDLIQQLLRVGNIIEEYRFLGQDRRLTNQLFERGAYSVEVGFILTLVFQKPQEGTCKESTERPDPPTMPVTCSIEASKESTEMSLFYDEKLQIKLKEIVIFGDNNYALLKALFNLRNKSTKGIIVNESHYHHHHHYRHLRRFCPICHEQQITPPEFSFKLDIHIDTNTYAGKVVCYKFPPYSRGINEKKLTSFMQDIGCQQDNNDYLLIVLTRQSQYESLDKKYKETLESGKDLEGYKFLGEAKELTKQLCDHGFKDTLQAEYMQHIKHIIGHKQKKFSDSAMAATKQEKREIPAMKPISLVFQKVQAT